MKILIPVAVLLIVFVSAIFYFSFNSSDSSIIIANGTAVVKLSSSSMGQYDPSEIRVTVGTKVRIEGDTKTLVDGMDTVVVEGYNLTKKISEGDNVLEFVANKKGEYDVRCANFMGNAKLIVE